MITVGDIYAKLNQFAPFGLAMEWDNSGLLIGSADLPADGVTLALDATPAVIKEAEKRGDKLIITHHPIIFEPLKAVQADSVVYRCIQNGISVISAHTNLDVARCGVNDALAAALGLKECREFEVTQKEYYRKIVVFVPWQDAAKVKTAMAAAGAGALGNYSGCAFSMDGLGEFLPEEGSSPVIGKVGVPERVKETRIEMIVPPDRVSAVVKAMKEAHPYEMPAYDLFQDEAAEAAASLGRVGVLPQPMQPQEFAAMVKESLRVGGLKYVPGNRPVRTVAICGGSGADLISLAKAKGADALVTGDTKHHLLLLAEECGVTLVDSGHFATEAVVLSPLKVWLEAQFPQGRFTIAESSRDPAYYL